MENNTRLQKIELIRDVSNSMLSLMNSDKLKSFTPEAKLWFQNHYHSYLSQVRPLMRWWKDNNGKIYAEGMLIPKEAIEIVYDKQACG